MAALNGDIESDDGSAVGRVREPGACAPGRARRAEGSPARTPSGQQQRRRSTPTLGPVAAPEPYRNVIAGLAHRSEREVTDNRLGSAASG